MISYQQTILKTCIIAICALPFLFSACSRKVYAPSQVLAPNLQKQHDWVVTGGLLAGDEIQGAEIQAAYSPFKHVSVMGSYSSMKAANNDIRSFGRLWELGLGTYIPSGKGNFEFSAGYGQAFNHMHLAIGSWAEMPLQRYHVQGTYTYSTQYLQFFFGARFAGLRVLNSTIILSEETSNQAKNELDFLRRNTPFTLVEPTWGLRIGSQGYYLVLQRTSTFSALSRRNLSANVASLGLFIEADALRPKQNRRSYNQ